MPETNGNGAKVLSVKNWHVVLTLVAWLALAVASWATQKTQLDDLARRVSALEEQRVTKNEFEMAIQDLKDRLNDIKERIKTR